MNAATIEDSRRPAENKIDRSFDVAVLIILAALLAVCVECILEAEKTTVLKIGTVGRNKTGNCLPHGTCRVLEGDILGIKIRSIDVTAGRTGSSHVLTEYVLLVCEIVIGQYRTIFANQGDINLTFGDDYLFFVSAFADKDCGTYIFAKVGDSINGFLHSEEITAAVLSHHIIIMTDTFRQFRNLFADGFHRQSRYGSCPIDIQMSIVLTSLRKGRNPIGFYKHEQLFRLCGTKSLHQVVRDFIQVDKGHSQLFGNIAGRIQICPMSIEQNGSFFGLLFGCTGYPSDVFRNRSIFRLNKVTADDGIE